MQRSAEIGVAGLAVAWLFLAAAGAGAHGGHDEPAEDPALPFALPEAGSYELPPIQRVASHRLLDPAGEAALLPGLAEGEVGVVAFVYRSCPEAGGCPMALAQLQRLDRALAQRPELAARVQLAAVSFDPERDKPAGMGELRDALRPRTRWRFLTARDAAGIRPVLEDYGQDLQALPGPDGAPTGLLRHVLRVFLVDARGDVRNVYSAGFLDWRIVLRDLETLLREGSVGTP